MKINIVVDRQSRELAEQVCRTLRVEKLAAALRQLTSWPVELSFGPLRDVEPHGIVLLTSHEPTVSTLQSWAMAWGGTDARARVLMLGIVMPYAVKGTENLKLAGCLTIEGMFQWWTTPTNPHPREFLGLVGRRAVLKQTGLPYVPFELPKLQGREYELVEFCPNVRMPELLVRYLEAYVAAYPELFD